MFGEYSTQTLRFLRTFTWTMTPNMPCRLSDWAFCRDEYPSQRTSLDSQVTGGDWRSLKDREKYTQTLLKHQTHLSFGKWSPGYLVFDGAIIFFERKHIKHIKPHWKVRLLQKLQFGLRFVFLSCSTLCIQTPQDIWTLKIYLKHETSVDMTGCLGKILRKCGFDNAFVMSSNLVAKKISHEVNGLVVLRFGHLGYIPVNSHEHGEMDIWRCISYWRCWFIMGAMLVFHPEGILEWYSLGTSGNWIIHGWSTYPPLTYPPPRNKALIRDPPD